MARHDKDLLEHIGKGSVPVLVGFIMGSIFSLVGLFGTIMFMPRVLEWNAAKKWPSVQGTITGGDVEYSRSRRSMLARPAFDYEYEWQGTKHKAHGYDITGTYVSDGKWVDATMAAYPPGTTVQLILDPNDPARAYLTRGSVGRLWILFIPPVFLTLGLFVLFLSILGRRGAFDESSRHPAAGIARFLGKYLLRPAVLKTIFFLGFFLTVGIVGYLAVAEKNPVLYVLVGIMLWGLWSAMKPRQKKRR